MALDGFDKWAPSWTSVDGLAAPTRAPATHASVAASIPRHNGAADGTAWRVAHVNQVLQRVGGVMVAGQRTAGNRRSLDSPARRGLTRDDITKKRRAITRG